MHHYHTNIYIKVGSIDIVITVYRDSDGIAVESYTATFKMINDGKVHVSLQDMWVFKLDLFRPFFKKSSRSFQPL